jgi:hypothetical protein
LQHYLEIKLKGVLLKIENMWMNTKFHLNLLSEIQNNLKLCVVLKKLKTKLHGLSSRANYTDRATAACRRRDRQLLRIEGATWSAWRIPTAVFSVSGHEPLFFYQVAPQLYSRGWVDPVPDPLLFVFW